MGHVGLAFPLLADAQHLANGQICHFYTSSHPESPLNLDKLCIYSRDGFFFFSQQDFAVGSGSGSHRPQESGAVGKGTAMVGRAGDAH